jgi:Tfp pilus assembly protein PilF
MAVPCAAALALGLGACGSSGSSNENVATTLGRAISETQTGNFDAATKDFEKVLKKDPQNKYAHYNLGYIAQTQGNRANAETEYRLALAADPKFQQALYNLAIAVTADGDKQAAIGLYRQAIAVANDDASSHFNLGLLLRQTGKTKEGNSEVQLAVRLNPGLAESAKAQGVPLK